MSFLTSSPTLEYRSWLHKMRLLETYDIMIAVEYNYIRYRKWDKMSYLEINFLDANIRHLRYLRRLGFNETYEIVYRRYYNKIGMLRSGGYE